MSRNEDIRASIFDLEFGGRRGANFKTGKL
jgi:hypothetical protein